MSARTPSDAARQTLLRELERALLDALAESPEVHRQLDRLRAAGLTARLVLDCAGGDESPAAPSDHRAEAPFRIDGRDLAFLRSIGIDPTRRLRTKKRRSG